MKTNPLLLILLACNASTTKAEFFDLELQADATIIGSVEMGTWVAPAGDFNGDGRDDFFASSPGYLPGPGSPNFARGRVALFYGRDRDDRLEGSFIEPEADVLFTGAFTRDFAGDQIASAGDVNGDGYDDLLIATETSRIDSPSYVYLVYGRGGDAALSGGFDLANADVRFKYDVPGDQFRRGIYNTSFSVSSGGDLNGDGYDELIIGAHWAGGGDEGKAFLFYGQPGVALSGEIDLASADVTFVGENRLSSAGLAVASAGDVNGDGYDDLLIGSPDAQGSSGAGAAYVVYGAADASLPSGITSLATADVKLTGVGSADRAGSAVSAAGDVNGDGLGDILVGARGADPLGRDNAGTAYLVLGREAAEPLPAELSLAQADVTIQGAATDSRLRGDLLGRSVSAAGDIDRDGLGDILLGATNATRDGRRFTGEAYLVFGSTLTELQGGVLDAADADVTFGRGRSAQDLIGHSVASPGDIDGDGLSDLLIGAPMAQFPGLRTEGATYIIYGSTLVPEPSALVLLVIGLTVPSIRGGRALR